MAKRIYNESVKKWAKVIGIPAGSVGTMVGLIFLYLSMSGAITITGFSGDQYCAGTELDPCYAYVNFTAKEDIFIYPIGYDPWGRNTIFEFTPGVKDWKLQRSWGKGWRDIPLNETCTGTWCGAPNSDGVAYSYVLRNNRDYQFRVVAYKHSPKDKIKWAVNYEDKEYLDPTWLPTNNYVISNYDESNEIITFRDDNGFGNVIGEVQLKTPKNFKVAQGYNYVWELDAVVYDDNNYNDFIKGFEFEDRKNGNAKVNRDMDIKILSYEYVDVEDYYYKCGESYYDEDLDTELNDCEKIITETHIEQQEVWTKVTVADLKKADGKVTLRGYTDVQIDDKIDWSTIIFGVRVGYDIWAEWEQSYDVGIELYYKFDEASGNATDATGNHSDGNSTGIEYSNDGIIIDSYTFTALSSDRVDMGFVPSGTTFTYNSWVYFTSACSTGTYKIASSQIGSNGFYLGCGTGGNLLTLVGYGSATSSLLGSSSLNGFQDGWIMITITYDDSDHLVKTYINGTQYTSYSLGDDISWGSGSILVGNRYNGALRDKGFPGRIDGVALWNRRLSPTEVLGVYDAGLSGNEYGESIPPIDDIPVVTLNSPENDSDLTNATVIFNCSAYDAINLTNVTFYIDGVANETNTSGVNNTNYLWERTLPDNDYNWTCIAVDNSSNSSEITTFYFSLNTTNTTTPPSINLEGDILSYYELEQSSGAVIDSNDVYNGTNIGATRGVTGKIGDAFNFTEGDWINTNLTFGGISNRTITAWINVTELGGGAAAVGLSDLVAGLRLLTDSFLFGLNESGNLILASRIDGTYEAVAVSTELVSINQWTFVAVTYNEDTRNATLYIDGDQVGSGIASAGDFGHSSNDDFLQIGSYGEGAAANFEGVIDEVGIMNVTLTAIKISSMWNNGDGRSYLQLFTEFPTVTLNSPVDDYASTENNITFSCYASDATNITNVSLIFDGSINQTNTSGVNNNNYTFFINEIPDGEYEWTCNATNQENISLAPSTRNLSIDTSGNAPNPPILNYPSDEATGVELDVILNVTVSDPEGDLMNVSFYGSDNFSGSVENFTLVVFGDTQHWNSPTGTNVADWIVNSKDNLSIFAVAGVGDIVDDYLITSQWTHMNETYSTFDGELPWFVVPGNHDFTKGTPDEVWTYYDSYFPASRFSSYDWYNGNHLDNRNSYGLFNISDDIKIGIINIQIRHNSSILAWANATVSNNPDYDFIVFTHAYLDNSNPCEIGDSDPTWGAESFWENFVRHWDNIVMVNGGHYTNPYVCNRTDIGLNGNDIYGVKVNWQALGWPAAGFGEQGVIRYYTFSPSDDKIYAYTYNVDDDEYNTSATAQFSLDYNMTSASATNYESICNVTDVANLSEATCEWNNLNESTSYNWYVNVTDGTGTTTSDVWSFTTTGGNNIPEITASAEKPDEIFTNTDWLINITATSNDTYMNVYTQFYVNDSAVGGLQVFNITNNTNSLIATLASGNFTGKDNLTADVWAGNPQGNSSNTTLTATVQFLNISGTLKNGDGDNLNASVFVVNQSDNSLVGNTTSINGVWTFGPVMPGTYIVTGYDPTNSTLDGDASPHVVVPV